MNFVLKTLKIISFLFIAIIFIILILFFISPNYTKKDLIKNYEKKRTEIYDVKKYINNIVPSTITVEIEFENDNQLEIFHIHKNGKTLNNWKLDINSSKTDSLLHLIGWNKETLKNLKMKLYNANCISVRNGEPCNIGFQRNVMDKYYYNLFQKAIPDSLKDKYNDGCIYIQYNDSVVLEYGSGAFGSICFPDNERK